ncbi:hypothetical protein D3C71_1517630 [compost metagenome]
MFGALRLGQRQVAGAVYGLQHVGRERRAAVRRLAGRGRDQGDATHQRGPVRRQRARDEVSVGVPGDGDRRQRLGLDNGGDVGRQVVQRQPRHRPMARADAARVRAQHAQALGHQQCGEVVEVGRTAAQRGEYEKRGALADVVIRQRGVAVDDGFGGGEDS